MIVTELLSNALLTLQISTPGIDAVGPRGRPLGSLAAFGFGAYNPCISMRQEVPNPPAKAICGARASWMRQHHMTFL
jgi:hypothetical protein